jgi:uncharacterized delta-60 repeat protein
LNNVALAVSEVTTDIDGSFNAGNSVSVQVDGKIVVAGYSYSSYNHSFALVRYHTNGLIDHTFGLAGIITTRIGDEGTTAKSAGILYDGKIIDIGYKHNKSDYDFALARYNSDGSTDNTFSTNGQMSTLVENSNDYCNALAIQPDGKIIVAGSSSLGSDEKFSIARYTSVDDTQAFIITPTSVTD